MVEYNTQHCKPALCQHQVNLHNPHAALASVLIVCRPVMLPLDMSVVCSELLWNMALCSGQVSNTQITHCCCFSHCCRTI